MKKIVVFYFFVCVLIAQEGIQDSVGFFKEEGFVRHTVEYYNGEETQVVFKHGYLGDIKTVLVKTDHYFFEVDSDGKLISAKTNNIQDHAFISRINQNIPCHYNLMEKLRYIAKEIDIHSNWGYDENN